MRTFNDIFKLFNLYIKKYMKLLILLMLIVIIQSVISLCLPVFVTKLIDDGITKQNVTVVKNVIMIYTLMFIVKSIINCLHDYIITYLSNKTDMDLSLDLVNKIFNQDLSFFSIYENGELIQRVLSEIDNIKVLYIDYFNGIISQIFSFVFCMIIVSNIEPKLVLLVIILVPIMYFIFYITKTSHINKHV